MGLIERHGAIGATLDRAARFAASAKAELALFPDEPYRRSLLAVADYTIRRAR